MKFGKFLEARELELPEYNSHFIDYKALKKLIKQLAIPLAQTSPSEALTLDDLDEAVIYQRLQENKASFFFKLERELEKVNSYYVEKEADLKFVFDILKTKYKTYKDRGQLASKVSVSYKNIHAGFKKYQKDLANLEQYIELNRSGFSKVLKKWDKRSHSQQKEFYLATVVSVQPIFTSNEVAKLNDATLAILMKLDDINNNENTDYYPYQKDTTSMDGLISTLPLDASKKLTGNHSSFQKSILDYSRSSLINTEIEIENWYTEIINISKLKDNHRKFQLIREFSINRIEKAIDDTVPQSRIDKTVILKECLTKLFLLLVGCSAVDDVSLHVFYSSTRDKIDLSYCDEDDQVFSRRNFFHEAANCHSQSRIFVLREALIASSAQTVEFNSLSKEKLKSLLNAQDLYQRTPLHYAAELGKLEIVHLLLSSGMLDSVDVLDNNSHTPLVLSIINNNIEAVQELLENGQANPFPKNDANSKPQFAPLIVACSYNNFEAAHLLLKMGEADVAEIQDAEGLGTLHIVAKEGGDAQLIQLLVDFGADPNGFDNFNVWTPIFYAIQEGHADTVQQLLNSGARLDITDSNNLGPVYYAIWEGHVDVLNVLLQNVRVDEPRLNKDMMVPPVSLKASELRSRSNSFHDIPDFALPPPFIPLRKYGHNFLEKKIFIKMMLQPGSGSIKLNNDAEVILSSPGRITLTSSVSDFISRNIILPLSEEDEREIVFQFDSIDNFSVDFEVFPAFGTRIIAKTTAISSTFDPSLVNGTSTIVLPLFDARLTNVGTLSFDYQIILPYTGRPLEITKYETYWKSTSGPAMNLKKDSHQVITSSSLSGSFVNIKICPLKDGTLVVSPKLFFEINSVRIFLTELTKQQLESFYGSRIDSIPDIKDETSLVNLLSFSVFAYADLLKSIPSNIQLEIQVCFPTTLEIEDIPVNLGPSVNINQAIDNVLYLTFEHVRGLRHSGQQPRPIVLSSCNWKACAIMNWKQPNFPVLYHMKDLRKLNNEFVQDTSHNLLDMAVSKVHFNFSDNRSKNLRQILRLAVNNNILGIIFPYELLKICSPLVDAIREQGLLLIASTLQNSKEVRDQEGFNDDNINGFHRQSELIFTGNVEM
ncbi:hypothetical protein HG535_0E01140 [Zygotorulaspora mrakii]|uniref:SPX domain-containing protein n=1 Tax=Zygotorulaspora mrakii TaxID=42260 RepID=A0A7H9B326_ZYGMR|nr:uncharacterized protein HG535_0E01140 [Zygotorulaspora mrakii]QLG73030.1 hypothetical protein HG535_0E01140 [Zygotorulaspora mrakii]